jgi:hypothetical protein
MSLSIPFLNLLSPADQAGYAKLQQHLASGFMNRRHQAKALFGLCLSDIRQFVMRPDADIANRGCVCGIFWGENAIAVNIQQLRLLTGRSKASLNGLFAKLNYETLSSDHEAANSIMAVFPPVVGNRQWTVRQIIPGGAIPRSKTPEPVPVPTGPVPICQAQPHADTAPPPSPPPLAGSTDYGDVKTDQYDFLTGEYSPNPPPIDGTGNVGAESGIWPRGIPLKKPPAIRDSDSNKTS